jgi:alpha-tubulin suppressor-like RCC1 family protein
MQHYQVLGIFVIISPSCYQRTCISISLPKSFRQQQSFATSIPGAIKVECGSQFSVALTRSGSVFTWGKGDYHRLCHGTDDHVRRPRKVTARLHETPSLYKIVLDTTIFGWTTKIYISISILCHLTEFVSDDTKFLFHVNTTELFSCRTTPSGSVRTNPNFCRTTSFDTFRKNIP